MNILRQFRALFRRKTLDAEMSAEMRHHLDAQMRRNLAAGMSLDEAHHEARRSFGGVEQIKERAREQRGWLWWEQIRQDLRFGARTLAKAPGFTAVAVITLALGIGVNTSLFSVVYGVLLEPYPYAKSNEIWATELKATTTGREWGWHVADYLEIAKLPAVRSAMATGQGRSTLSGGVNPEIISTPRLTATAFEFLGVPPVLGRGFTAADFSENGEPQPVAVISFRFWQRMFNGAPDALGRTLVLDDRAHTIIGVMPPRFTWYGGDAWLPLATTNRDTSIRPIVRLHGGVTREVAGEQLLALVRAASAQNPGPYPKDGFTARFVNYLDVTVASGEMRSSLTLLLYAVGFLLLIACTNVANLQLARGAVRAREIAVGRAKGARRGPRMRPKLKASGVRALLGGALGVFLAFGFTQLIVALMPDYYVPSEARVTMNGWVLLFSAGVSVLTGVLFGLVPGLQCTRPDLTDALKAGGHGAAAGASGNRTRNTLAVVEIALAIILLVGASLTIRGFVELQRVDRGFRADRLVMLDVPLPAKRYPTLEQRNGFARDYLERLRNLPGVASATLGALPGFEAGSGVTIPGQPKVQDGVTLNYVAADYIATLGLALRAGRNLTEQDVAHGDRVAVITETAAKLWADGQSPVGRTLAIDSLVGGGPNNLAPPNATKDVTVVGVVADVRSGDRRRPPQAGVLVPYSLRGPTNRPFLVRARGEPSALINAMRSELRAMDATQPMRQPLIVEDYLDRQAMQPRFNLVLFASLAGIALGLAAVGIYSVLSYNVAQRTREIGVRIALGAARRDIFGLVLGSGGRLLGVGMAIGIAASVALTQLVKSQVFNVPLLDPIALAAAVAVLGAVALFACWWPARRATKVDPMIALRAD